MHCVCDPQRENIVRVLDQDLFPNGVRSANVPLAPRFQRGDMHLLARIGAVEERDRFGIRIVAALDEMRLLR